MDNIEQDNRPKLLQMLRELTELQTNNMNLQAAIFVREARTQVEEKTKEFAQSIQESAKSFGQRAQNLARELVEEYNSGKQGKGNIIENYKKSLAEINEEFNLEMQDILYEKQFYEEQELLSARQESYLKYDRKQILKSPKYKLDMARIRKLKREIKSATNRGEYNLAETKIKELKDLEEINPMANINRLIAREQNIRKVYQNAIRLCDEKIKACKADRFEAIIGATADKNTELINVNNTTPIKRFLGSILNTINGANRFKNIILDRMQNNINITMTEYIPAIKEKIQNRRKEASEKRKELQEKARESFETGIETSKETLTGIRDNALEAGRAAVERGRENIDNLANLGRESVKSIIRRKHEIKLDILDRMQEYIENSREKEAGLQDRYEYHGKHFKKAEDMEK